MQKLQVETQQLKEKEEKMRAYLQKAGTGLAEKNKLLDECKAKYATLSEDYKQLQTNSGNTIY